MMALQPEVYLANVVSIKFDANEASLDWLPLECLARSGASLCCLCRRELRRFQCSGTIVEQIQGRFPRCREAFASAWLYSDVHGKSSEVSDVFHR